MTDSRIQSAEPPILHAVTDDAILTAPGFPAAASDVMRALGARGAVHLRAARLSAARLHALAATLAPLQAETGCLLVVNDRVDIALTVGAAAAQLTSRSLSVADARRTAPDLALGASVHSLEEAATARADGASWIVAGHVFETPTHPGADARGLDYLRSLVGAADGLPVIAIGGVRPEHVATLRAAGAHGVAAIRGIWAAENAERAAIAYLSSHDAHGGRAPPHPDGQR